MGHSIKIDLHSGIFSILGSISISRLNVTKQKVPRDFAQYHFLNACRVDATSQKSLRTVDTGTRTRFICDRIVRKTHRQKREIRSWWPSGRKLNSTLLMTGILINQMNWQKVLTGIAFIAGKSFFSFIRNALYYSSQWSEDPRIVIIKDR